MPKSKGYFYTASRTTRRVKARNAQEAKRKFEKMLVGTVKRAKRQER
jgi:hypothetical protein